MRGTQDDSIKCAGGVYNCMTSITYLVERKKFREVPLTILAAPDLQDVCVCMCVCVCVCVLRWVGSQAELFE